MKLAGMEEEVIPEIEEAADSYVEARNNWQRAKAPMDERYAILEAAMKKYKRKSYEFDGKK
ncbi:hypothetical protein, partial [Enterococcus casseliflavus]|uniref:hypothetical protein n=1 Tax=Enterococcus casseliflavus TaxID=37734 RepID=UPI003D0BCE36